MKHPTSLLSLFLTLAIAFGPAGTAWARDVAPPDRSPADDVAFLGTRAELVGYTVNRLLMEAGHEVRPANARLEASLRQAFGNSSAYQWENTLLVLSNAQPFTVTLPSTLGDISNGSIALGIVEHDTVVRAFRLTLSPTDTGYLLTIARPTGETATVISLGLDDSGRWLASTQDLRRLAVILFPTMASGVFDPLIETLQGILNMLYEIKNLINMTICIVNEMIEMFNDLNLCGWGEIQPGGGNIARLIVCTVQDVTEFLAEMTDHCL